MSSATDTSAVDQVYKIKGGNMSKKVQGNKVGNKESSINSHPNDLKSNSSSQNFQNEQSEDISSENLKIDLPLNEYGFVEDPRYKQCNTEALYGVGLGIINLIVWFVFGYGLGGKPIESYSYILGFPSWFFWSCIANSIFIIAMTFFVVDKKMVDMPLDRMDLEQASKYMDGGAK